MGKFLIIVKLPVVFISALLRSTFGFGNAVVAMPLLVLAMGMNIATPLVGLISTTISIGMFVKLFRKVDCKSLSVLIISTITTF